MTRMCRAPEEFDEVFHVNVAGVFATIQAFYPLLKVCKSFPTSSQILCRRHP